MNKANLGNIRFRSPNRKSSQRPIGTTFIWEFRQLSVRTSISSIPQKDNWSESHAASTLVSSLGSLTCLWSFVRGEIYVWDTFFFSLDPNKKEKRHSPLLAIARELIVSKISNHPVSLSFFLRYLFKRPKKKERGKEMEENRGNFTRFETVFFFVFSREGRGSVQSEQRFLLFPP